MTPKHALTIAVYPATIQPKDDSMVLVWTSDGHWEKAWFHCGAFVNQWGGDLLLFGDTFSVYAWAYVDHRPSLRIGEEFNEPITP